MFKFFDFIVDLIGIIVDTVINFIQTIIFLIGYMIQGLAYVQTCMLLMPPWVMPFVLAIISISIIYLLIGR